MFMSKFNLADSDFLQLWRYKKIFKKQRKIFFNMFKIFSFLKSNT
jgi:hypothetical protein